MRLGLTLSNTPADAGDVVALVRAAESFGYDVCWASEAYGADAVSTLAWLAAQTATIGLGAGVLQIPARTPAMTAMTAANLDLLSGGRFRLGLGVSGPQVSEGWHGVRFADPLGRTREYVGIVRRALARQPVEHTGEHWTLPLPDGPGKALRLSIRPPRPDLPVYLASVGPRNLRLTGEIADGWLGVFLDAGQADRVLAPLREGLAASPDPDRPFDVCVTTMAAAGPGQATALAPMRAVVALYVGGMGSRDQNFYHRLVREQGFAAEAAQIQDRYLEGRHREAAEAVPDAMLEAVCLLGSSAQLRDRLHAYAAAGVSTLCVTPTAPTLEDRVSTLRLLADALTETGLAR